MRGTRKSVGYYGKWTVSAYIDSDYDTTDTYSITTNYALLAVMCSHNSPEVQMYDGGSWRQLADPAGNPIGARAVNEFMVVSGVIGRGAGSPQVGVRISAPAVDNTTLCLQMGYTAETSV